MASDEEKKGPDSPEGATPPPQKKGGKGKLILFGGIGLVCVLLGVGAAFFLTKGDKSAETPAAHGDQAAESEEPKESKEEKESGHGGDEEESDVKGADGTTVYTIKDIVVNPAGTGGQRYLSVSFAFELKGEKLKQTFENREPIIRDALITILSSKTVAQLTDAREKEIIRLQVRKRLVQMLKTKELAGVYYSDFVLQ